MMSDEKDVFHENECFRGYKIKRLLGKGGLAAVYLAHHEMLDSLFAIKVLYPEIARTTSSCVKRFLREAKISARIRHPNLVQVHDCGFDREKNIYYIIMDYVSGGNLREALAFSGKFGCVEALKIVGQVACALNVAQQYGIVHRDIKPENIMLQEGGGVKLVDLGIAKAVGFHDSLRTTIDLVFGTPYYVSPEQILSPSDVDVRADIYSLGVVFFEMLTGKNPFDGETAPSVLQKLLSDEPLPDVRKFNSEVPADIASLIIQMCEKDRSKRLSSLSEVIKRLRDAGYDASCDAELSGVCVENGSLGFGAEEFGIDLNNLPSVSQEEKTFDTDDIEIQKFITRMNRRRLVRKVLFTAAWIALIVMVVLVIIW